MFLLTYLLTVQGVFDALRREISVGTLRCVGEQVLRDWFHQAWNHRRLEAEGGDERRCRPDHQLQAGQPDHVRVGNTRSSVGGRLLRPRHFAQRQLHQQVITSSLAQTLMRQFRINTTGPCMRTGEIGAMIEQ